ncbi:MAG: DUF2461 domain-containing protein [Ginsengibacter sp.]
MFEKSTVVFLKKLSKNNNKAWFDTHRPLYTSAKEDFEKFVATILDKFAGMDPDLKDLEVKNCTFRMNRDIRFSKDKTPYKINMGASFNRGGKKSVFAGYYFHLEPGEKSFAGGGLWMPMPPDLKKIRQEIDYCFEDFTTIVSGKKFKAEFNKLEDTPDVKLTNIPKGYEKDNRAAEFLKLKSLLATRPVSDQALTSHSLVSDTIRSFTALVPLIKFLNRALEN